MNEIGETDWEIGKPPNGIKVEAFILGQVRKGRIQDGYFRFLDVTPTMQGGSPLQNTIFDPDRIVAWRYNPSAYDANLDKSAMLSGRIYMNSLQDWLSGLFNNNKQWD